MDNTYEIVLILFLLLVLFLQIIRFFKCKRKDNFDGKLCFNTQFPTPPIYNTTKNFVDYSQFSIDPQKIVNPNIKKNFSPKALNFHIGLPTRTYGKELYN